MQFSTPTYRKLTGISTQRLDFAAVTLVTVLLAAIGLVTVLLRPYVAPPPENRALQSGDAFLSRASHQLVDWQLLTKETLATARRLERPILLVIGVSSSGFGREIDEQCFTESEIARYMNTNFICVRVDGLDHPELLSGFYPISRVKAGIMPGFQIWVLDPEAKIVKFVGRTSDQISLSREEFFNAMIDAVATYREGEGSKDPSIEAAKQMQDVAAIDLGGSLEDLDIPQFTTSLLASIDPVYGGMPQGTIQPLRPNALRYLFQVGRSEEAEFTLRRMVLSPMFDLIDGGFFRLTNQLDFTQVEFNKEAMANAEMLVLTGIAETTTNIPLYGFAGRQTFDLLDSRMRTRGSIAAFQVEDESAQNRNRRYSFNLRRMRETLTPSERTWVRDHLGLEIPRNPQMVPYLLEPDAFNQELFYPILHKLRKANEKNPRHLVGSGYLEQEAFAAARMVEWSRIVGDKKRLHRSMERVAELERYRDSEGVFRRIVPGGERVPGKLGDYLAYADARLQAYQASGRPSHLEAGQTVLQQAIRQFSSGQPGNYLLSQNEPILPEARLPEVLDNLCESTSARMIRLQTAFGRLTGQFHLTIAASDVIARFAKSAVSGGPQVAGYQSASLTALDPTYAITIGRNAVSEAASLQKLCPTRFVGVGTARLDLAILSPGVYLVSDKVAGPFTVKGAALLMPAGTPIP